MGETHLVLLWKRLRNFLKMGFDHWIGFFSLKHCTQNPVVFSNKGDGTKVPEMIRQKTLFWELVHCLWTTKELITVLLSFLVLFPSHASSKYSVLWRIFNARPSINNNYIFYMAFKASAAAHIFHFNKIGLTYMDRKKKLLKQRFLHWKSFSFLRPDHRNVPQNRKYWDEKLKKEGCDM